MTGFPNSPRLVKGGIVVIDADSSAVQRIIALQYNPDSVSRSLQVQALESGGGDVSEALRLTGPAIETITLEAEMDAADYLEQPDRNPGAVQYGLHPQLAALEALVNPTSAHLNSVHGMAGSGSLEIIPPLAPLTVFVWGSNRIQPVRLTEFSVTEEAFDPALNPIRVKLNLGLRVLSVMDVGFDNRAGSLYMSYLGSREAMAKRLAAADFNVLGIGGL